MCVSGGGEARALCWELGNKEGGSWIAVSGPICPLTHAEMKWNSSLWVPLQWSAGVPPLVELVCNPPGVLPANVLATRAADFYLVLNCFNFRFKTAEIADEFKKAFDEAKDGKGKALDLPPTPVRVRERTDSSSRDSTRERKDSARERKDSAKERERRQSSGRSDTPDKLKPSSSLESFAFKPQVSAPTTASSASKVSFAIGSSGDCACDRNVTVLHIRLPARC